MINFALNLAAFLFIVLVTLLVAAAGFATYFAITAS